MLWRLKGCPKCGGDLIFEDDNKTWHCLQCGKETEEKKELVLVRTGRTR